MCVSRVISIHALLAESDLLIKNHIFCHSLFLSTLSLRRATIRATILEEVILYFYPRSPCGERPAQRHKSTRQIKHFYPRSPCGERRGQLPTTQPPTMNFYPRSPCGERLCVCWMVPSRLLFLSTLSLRRATNRPGLFFQYFSYFYPRSPCGERQNSKCQYQPEYIHFYPRSPCGERHARRALGFVDPDISIHALLAESDIRKRQIIPIIQNFYPRSPCGERLID